MAKVVIKDKATMSAIGVIVISTDKIRTLEKDFVVEYVSK
jgi:hypothetical protein